MKYNPQIHNRRSVRLKEYDYSQEGLYFITICCNDRACLFGEIINGEMILNANGIIAYNEWLKTNEIRSNVELDVFVIMPNHMHGIIIIKNDDHRRGVLHTPGSTAHTPGSSVHTPGSIMHKPNLSTSTNSIMNEFDNESHLSVIEQGVCNTPLQNPNVCNIPLRSPSNTIGAIVRGYKSAVTKQMNILGSGTYNQSTIVWQRNYHEHIIRNEQSYQNIADYIVNNPAKWNADRYR